MFLSTAAFGQKRNDSIFKVMQPSPEKFRNNLRTELINLELRIKKKVEIPFLSWLQNTLL